MNEYMPFELIDEDGQQGLELSVGAGDAGEIFEELGHLGNGHDWTRLIRNLLKDKSKSTLKDLQFSSEADFFVVYSDNPSALKTIANQVSEFFDDREKLRSTIQTYGGH